MIARSTEPCRKPWRILRSNFYEREMREEWQHNKKNGKTLKQMWAGAHQIRFNTCFDQSRSQDLRTSVEISTHRKVLDGDLDRLSKPA